MGAGLRRDFLLLIFIVLFILFLIVILILLFADAGTRLGRWQESRA
jgi:hypothetical protein